MEIIYIGSTPNEEECAQVGSPDYYEQAKKECRAYVNQLWRTIERAKGLTRESAPESFALSIKANPHDYGTYHEVIAKASEDDEAAIDLAYWVESNSPANWDDEAKEELGEDER